MSEYKLIKEIIALSSSSIWDIAKLEWSLHEIYETEDPDTCLCGKFPIIEICILYNRVNGNYAIVGNCCVKKFLGLPSDKIFQAVKRVKKDITKSLNTDAIEHAFNKGWLNKWEFDFYIDIMHKRNLTQKQAVKKIEINEKIAQLMRRSATQRN
jgi:hypothetical protein